MKKSIVRMLCILFIASSVYAETESQNFFIEFNKSLPITLVFYDPAVYDDPTSDYDEPTSNNPPEPISSISFTSDQYGTESEHKSFGIFWNLDVNTILARTGSSSLAIDLYFYAESSSAESFDYMLRSDHTREAGLNYYVKCTDQMPGSANLVEGIINTTDPAASIGIEKRTINLAANVANQATKTDWYVFDMYVPAFTSTTLPLGGYSGNIAIVLTTN